MYLSMAKYYFVNQNSHYTNMYPNFKTKFAHACFLHSHVPLKQAALKPNVRQRPTIHGITLNMNDRFISTGSQLM